MTVKEILDSLCKSLGEFGKSMQSIQDEFADDISKSNIQKEKYAKIDKENLKKIWGKKE